MDTNAPKKASRTEREVARSTFDPQISEVGTRLIQRLDEVTAAMVDRILSEVPAYRRLPPDGIENVGQLATRNARILANSLSTGNRLDRDDLRFVAEHARERQRSGVSLESMLHAYRVGTTALWEESIVEGVALGFSRDTALELARRTSELTDDLTTHAAETYVREESRLKALSDRAARDLLESLLRGESDLDALQFHLVAPGLDSVGSTVVVLARISSSPQSQSDTLSGAATAIAGALATGRASPLLAVRSGAVVAVAPLEEGVSVAHRLSGVHAELLESGTKLFCGISARCTKLADIPTGFDQAALAVSRASDDQPVVSLSELPVIQTLLIGATTTMRGMLISKAREMNLDDQKGLSSMRETLQALAECNLNLSLTARKLHVHTNTLRYRLRRIAERTDRDPQDLFGLIDLLCLVALLDGADDKQPTSTYSLGSTAEESRSGSTPTGVSRAV